MHQGRVTRGVVEIDDGGKWFDRDVDHRSGVDSGVPVDRDDCDHRFTYESHGALGDQRTLAARFENRLHVANGGRSRSSPVNTPSTPGSFLASSTSYERMRPWAYSLRTKCTHAACRSEHLRRTCRRW